MCWAQTTEVYLAYASVGRLPVMVQVEENFVMIVAAEWLARLARLQEMVEVVAGVVIVGQFVVIVDVVVE